MHIWFEKFCLSLIIKQQQEMKNNSGVNYFISRIHLILIIGVLTSCFGKRKLVPPVAKSEVETRTLSDLNASDSVQVEVDLEHEYDEDVELRYRIQDHEGNYYTVNDKNGPIKHVQALIDSQWVEIEKWELVEKEMSNCMPHDYALILDMSGSMKKNEELISKEALSFIRYKNEEDQVSLIKYATTPLLVSPFSDDEGLLSDSLLHKKDTMIGGFTKTGLAYSLYNDELKDFSPNQDQSVILFSDLSGASDELFDSLARFNGENDIATHKVIYFPEEQKSTFFFRFIYSKDLIRRAFESRYGEVFRVENYENIGSSLRRIIDQNCTFNKILFSRPENATKYRIVSQINGKTFTDEIPSTIPATENQPMSKDSAALTFGNDTLRVGRPILLNVYYDTGSDSLLQESNEEINRVFEILTQYPTLKIEIRGHTDNRGTKAYNNDLSKRRANEVLESLVEKGIESSRMTAKGYGYDQPIATNETEEGRAKNRRTEFVIKEQ